MTHSVGGGRELQQRRLLFPGQRAQHVPEQLDDRVLRVVSTGIVCVGSQVVDVDAASRSADELLQLALAEHLKPFHRDDLTQAVQERRALALDLKVQPVVRHAVDVVHAVLVGHCDVLAVVHQLRHAALVEIVVDLLAATVASATASKDGWGNRCCTHDGKVQA